MRKMIILAGILASWPLGAQSPAYYVMNERDGRITPVERGDPASVNPIYWRLLFYRTGAAKGGKDYWGSTSGATAQEVMADLKSSQKAEIASCRVDHKQAPCEATTWFNYLGPIAVFRENPKTSPGEIDFPSAKKTELAVLSRLVTHWGEELKGLRDELIGLERGETPTSQNPYHGVGNVVKEYRDLLADAEKQYHSARDLMQKAERGYVTTDREIQRFSEPFDDDVSRMRAVPVASPIHQSREEDRPSREPAPNGRRGAFSTSPAGMGEFQGLMVTWGYSDSGLSPCPTCNAVATLTNHTSETKVWKFEYQWQCSRSGRHSFSDEIRVNARDKQQVELNCVTGDQSDRFMGWSVTSASAMR